MINNKILIADDNPEIREVLNVLLSSEGYEVIEAKDGQEVINLIDADIDLYILDIIQINPLWEKAPVQPWRFLNPDRVSVLDVDSDIEGSKRGKVLTRLREYYGKDRVANVATFGTEGSKQAIATAIRGLGYDVDLSLYLSSLIPADRGKVRTLHQCYYGDEKNALFYFLVWVDNTPECPDQGHRYRHRQQSR